MFGKVSSMLLTRRSHGRQIKAILRALVLTVLTTAGAALPTVALAAEGPSGLPLPRFVTTRSNPINVRVGPGTKYDVAWVYVKAGTPVEIIQEFDTWRKIRDADGSEGWLHQNLLQGKRAGLVSPSATEPVALRRDPDDQAGVRAWLTPSFRVDLKECDGKWCKVVATAHPVNGSPQSFDGWMHQADLWGVYKDEAFD
jgi:SH3-like domain-containing protein